MLRNTSPTTGQAERLGRLHSQDVFCGGGLDLDKFVELFTMYLDVFGGYVGLSLKWCMLKTGGFHID